MRKSRKTAEKQVSAEQPTSEETLASVTHGWFNQTQLKQFLESYGASTLFHAAVLIALLFVVLPADTEPVVPLIESSVTEEEPDTELDEIVTELNVEEVPQPVDEPETADTSELLGEVSEDIGIDVASISLPSIPLAVGNGGDNGIAKSIDVKGKAITASFFGSKSKGKRFVFVVDNSLSMGRGRFETACNELAKSVNKMDRRQQFYVIFFSDTAYPLFYPRSVRSLVAATPDNKRKLAYWLETVELCLRTNGCEAVQAAIAMRPDVIYILGDGAFTDNTGPLLTQNSQNRIPIHTLGMQVNPRDEAQFLAIAVKNGGTYRDVGVDPAMRKLAQRNPRKRNHIRGPIWGLKLPLQAKKKKKKK